MIRQGHPCRGRSFAWVLAENVAGISSAAAEQRGPERVLPIERYRRPVAAGQELMSLDEKREALCKLIKLVSLTLEIYNSNALAAAVEMDGHGMTADFQFGLSFVLQKSYISYYVPRRTVQGLAWPERIVFAPRAEAYSIPLEVVN